MIFQSQIHCLNHGAIKPKNYEAEIIQHLYILGLDDTVHYKNLLTYFEC